MAAIPILLVLIIAFVLRSIRVVQEYERGVIFRLGRCIGAKGPGLFFIWPVIDKMQKVNLQQMAVPVQPQQVITKDNVSVVVDAVAYFKVNDPVASVVKINNWYAASQLVAQTTLRGIIGRHEMDQLLSDREAINSELRSQLDQQTEPWGVEVVRVEIRDVQLPEQMQRAMAKQAEAERERRAKIIAAEGELQAASQLSAAARMMSETPGALHLRTLQTLAEVAVEKNSTLVFPIPTEVSELFMTMRDRFRAGANAEVQPHMQPPVPPVPPTPTISVTP